MICGAVSVIWLRAKYGTAGSDFSVCPIIPGIQLNVLPLERLCHNSKKHLNSACHAGLDPASSNVRL
jgi:hypothetical protein